MKTLSDAEAEKIATAIDFINGLPSEDLVPLAEKMGRPGIQFVEVCRELSQIAERIRD